MTRFGVGEGTCIIPGWFVSAGHRLDHGSNATPIVTLDTAALTGQSMHVGQAGDGRDLLGGGSLSRALALTRADGGWAAEADPHFEGFNSMFGGWTAALALAAISGDAEADRVPAILSVNYVAPIPPGSPARIRTRCLGGGRSVSHWIADLYRHDSDDALATATVVTVVRRPTDGHLQVTMPDAPPPESLAEWHPPNPVGALIDVRPVRGTPPFGRKDNASLDWLRLTAGRAIDRLQVALLADACAPRPFFWSDGPRPSATLAMTVFFHATDDELAAVGDDYVLNEVTGARGNESLADQSLRMWSRQGVLLASSNQLCSYR